MSNLVISSSDMNQGWTISSVKLTEEWLARRACEMTMHGKESKIGLERLYNCEHSPIRTQLFWIELLNIPTFVSVHLVRHNVGVQHFVMSNRKDRGGTDEATRMTPVNHGMLINAQGLINMARKRLCMQASTETRQVMTAIRRVVEDDDPELAKKMVPECEYRGMICHELRPCGRKDVKVV